MFEKEISELKTKDEKLARIIEEVGEIDLSWSGGEPFEKLAQSIIYQQLATKAATTIWNRFKERTAITPQRQPSMK